MEMPRIKRGFTVAGGESSPLSPTKGNSIKKTGLRKPKQTSQQNLKAMLQEKFRETGQAVMLISRDTRSRRHLQSRLVLPTQEAFETAQNFYKSNFSTSGTKEIINDHLAAQKLARTQSLLAHDPSVFNERLEKQNKLHLLRESFYQSRTSKPVPVLSTNTSRLKVGLQKTASDVSQEVVTVGRELYTPKTREDTNSEESGDRPKIPPRFIVDANDPEGVYLPRSCSYHGLLKVPDILEYVPTGKEGVMRSLDNNQMVKGTLERYFNRTANNSFGELRSSLQNWNSREKVAQRQRVIEKRREEEELVMLPKKSRSTGSLPGASDRYIGQSLAELPDNLVFKPVEVYYKASWVRAFNEMVLPVSDTTKTIFIKGLPASVSKDRQGEGFALSIIDHSKAQIVSKIYPSMGFEQLRRDFMCKHIEDVGIVVFGGAKPMMHTQKLELFQQTLILEVASLRVTTINPDPEIQPFPGRVRAASCIFGRYMFVHGGRSSENRVTRDIQVLDAVKGRWIRIVVAHELPRLENHAMAAAFKLKSLEKQEDFFSDAMTQKEKPTHGQTKPRSLLQPSDGMYIFGGKSADRQESNQLWRLKIFCNPFTAELIHGSGLPPSPRQGCCLEYLRQHHSLVVYGGKLGHSYLADVYVFNLSYMTWIEVKNLIQYMPSPRAFFNSHAGTHNSHEALFIQGGVNSNNYLPGNIEVLTFEENLFQKNQLFPPKQQKKPLVENSKQSLPEGRASKRSFLLTGKEDRSRLI